MICSFRGKNFFLSNFYPTDITYNGLTFKSSEAAFQASKTLDEEERKKFCNLSPDEAKSLGYHVKLRSDWNRIKINVMEEILMVKFSNPELKKMLLETKNEILVEGNYWNDNFWGSCTCLKCKDKTKHNNLGILLMRIRSKIS